MTSLSWPLIRPGSQRVEVYNEGLLVFLLDEDQLATIQSSGADLETGYTNKDADIDKPLKRLAKEGILLAYELVQDDAVVVEVLVGPPLTKNELSMGRWQKPQSGFLKLPSGVLRIDTANTWPFDEEPDEEPGRVSVPPGDYKLSLYRLDWDELECDGLLKSGEEWRGPQEVLILTPLETGKTVKGIKPLLRVPGISPATWLGKYEIAGGVFLGKAFAHYARDYCSVNVDQKAADQLGIAPGVGLRIEVEGLTLEAVYHDQPESTFQLREWAKAMGVGRSEFGLIARPMADEISAQSLFVERIVATEDFPRLKKWIQAKVTRLDGQFELPVSPAKVETDDEEVNADELAEIEEMFEE